MPDAKKDRPSAKGRTANQKIEVQLDDSSLETHYANFANVSGSREEIMVDFGLSNIRRSGQPKVSIKVSNRFVLNPHTAKRLAVMMNQAINQYEARFGTIDIGAGPKAPDISHSADDLQKPN